MIILIIFVASSFLSMFIVGRVREIAISNQIIDIPNERSSHSVPTPRGGGLGIVLVVLIGTLLLGLLDLAPWNVVGAVLIGGFVAYIGYIDDRRDLSPLRRGLVHLIAASLGMALLGGMPPLDLGFIILDWGWFGTLVAIIGIVWMINLYNFMDGIDGLAGSEAVFVFSVGGIMLAGTGLGGLVPLCVLIAGACLGFLRWNWPPAKIFMGDVGSGFLGYLIAVLAIAASKQGFLLWVWLILSGVFIVDATITVIRRILRRAKWYAPHRSHAYQHLTMRWNSHLRATVAILLINVFWLAPVALTAAVYGTYALVGTVAGLLPLMGLALLLGAGQPPPETTA